MTSIQGPFVFVDIDTQRDFLEPSGALFIPGATEIHEALDRLTNLARRYKIPVLATACAHLPDDPEFEVFPPHCLLGTPGHERHDATAWPDTVILKSDDKLAQTLQTPPAHLTVHKTRYDVFSHPAANDVVDLFRVNDPCFVVYGVATDYCVRCAVDGLLERGCRVAIVTDAIRAVDPSAEPAMLTDFARRGALLTLSEVVASTLARD